MPISSINPALFAVFALTAIILSLKALFLGAATAATRGKLKSFLVGKAGTQSRDTHDFSRTAAPQGPSWSGSRKCPHFHECREAPKAALLAMGSNRHRGGAEEIAATAAFGGEWRAREDSNP